MSPRDLSLFRLYETRDLLNVDTSHDRSYSRKTPGPSVHYESRMENPSSESTSDTEVS